MLFVHDVHAVIGQHEFEFEDAMRDLYLPGVSADADTRVLWYMTSAHGSSDAYNAITVTAVRDGVAWERLVERRRYGDLSEWNTQAATLCYSSRSTLLVSTEASPLADLELASVPASMEEHPVQLFREDVLEGVGVGALLAAISPAKPDDDEVLQVEAMFRPAYGADSMVRILYRVAPQDRLTSAFGADLGWSDWSGSVTSTLPHGVQGSGRFLRTATWSPIT